MDLYVKIGSALGLGEQMELNYILLMLLKCNKFFTTVMKPTLSPAKTLQTNNYIQD